MKRDVFQMRYGVGRGGQVETANYRLDFALRGPALYRLHLQKVRESSLTYS